MIVEGGDGRELILTLAFPLPLSVVPELLGGISQVLKEVGYFNCWAAGDKVYGYRRAALSLEEQRGHSDG